MSCIHSLRESAYGLSGEWLDSLNSSGLGVAGKSVVRPKSGDLVRALAVVFMSRELLYEGSSIS